MTTVAKSLHCARAEEAIAVAVAGTKNREP
jgi:hypothetical protein